MTMGSERQPMAAPPGAAVPPGARWAAGGQAKRLDVDGLRSGYGRLTVLHDVDLHVEAGEALGVFGPNGAGKTTLLATIAGLLPTQSGTIVVGGTSLQRVAAHARVARGVVLVPEGRQVIGSLSVGANLDVMMLVRGRLTHDVEHRRRREEVLEMFPALRARLRVGASSLSGGEQQMLAIARALMCRPSVLLLDEPSQGLAPTVVELLADRLSQVKGTVTMVLVEQTENALLALADRRARMRMGRLEPATPTAQAE
jgi:branched-chain amino acid transport system ATP-binding protein